MMVRWEAQDLKPGQHVGVPRRAERWMIGYIVPEKTCDHRRHMLISLSDGMVQGPFTREQLCIRLNASGEIPEELLPMMER